MSDGAMFHRYGWRPYAAFAAQATVHQKYPIGGPVNSLDGNPPRMFHHNGHAKGVLYWWNRGNRRAHGPPPPERKAFAVFIVPRDGYRITYIDGDTLRLEIL